MGKSDSGARQKAMLKKKKRALTLNGYFFFFFKDAFWSISPVQKKNLFSHTLITREKFPCKNPYGWGCREGGSSTEEAEKGVFSESA